MPDTTALTQAELDAISYKAAQAAQAAVNARFDDLEKKAAIVAVAGVALWWFTRRR